MTLLLLRAMLQSLTGLCRSSEHFKLRNLGPTSFLLGIQITRDRSTRRIMLSQRQYILDMPERYGFSGCAPVKTPMESGKRFSAADGPTTPVEKAAMQKFPISMQLTLSCTWVPVPALISPMLCLS